MMVNKDYVANDADTAIVWPLNAIICMAHQINRRWIKNILIKKQQPELYTHHDGYLYLRSHGIHEYLIRHPVIQQQDPQPKGLGNNLQSLNKSTAV